MARAKSPAAARPKAGVIYDFGMNNGDDVEYYLLKADRVVGVEANPALCALVRERFAAEVANGRLVILNVALTKADSARPITFYVHKHNHVLSQLPKPPTEQLHDFSKIKVSCRTPASVVREFGDPLYVKVDVEHFDFEVLQNLFAAGIRPAEISAESHSIDVFAALIVNGYKAFTLIEGSRVAIDYRKATIETSGGPKAFRFRHHSAGPFGKDIRARWEDADSFLHTLAMAGLGWRDIHASLDIEPEPAPSNAAIARRHAFRLLGKAVHALEVRTIGRFRARRD